jgi:hypothetical protein
MYRLFSCNKPTTKSASCPSCCTGKSLISNVTGFLNPFYRGAKSSLFSGIVLKNNDT